VTPGTTDPRLIVFVGGSRDQRAATVRASVEKAAGPPLRELHVAAHWPFLRHIKPPMHAAGGDGPATLWLRDLDLAFPPQRMPGIRLVLTQSTYQLQRVLDALDTNPSWSVVADADRRLQSEISARRGPWARIRVVDLGSGRPDTSTFETRDGFEDVPSDAALRLHDATSQLERRDVDGARRSIEEAIHLDPSWEASHFELGKVCLLTEDTERAAAAFAEAGRLMPSFAAAFGNLGAALGELDRGDEALAALEQALRHDPHGFPILNNIGAVKREMGHLDEAEASFRQVVALAPSFVFGHYNLGQTLFLQGRFADARIAYEEGASRDPQKNPRQACRLAVARAASGDIAGAMSQIVGVSQAVPVHAMRELAGEMEVALLALSTLPSLAAIELSAVLDAVRRYRLEPTPRS
jgi:Tfp pilus assembly protein PilF